MFLRYKVKINTETLDYNEIFYDSLYLSPNFNYISGITDATYGLVDGQTIMLYMNEYDGYRPYPIQIKHVKQQGYVIYKQSFKIVNDTITYIDGLSYKIENNQVVINKKKYTVDGTYIEIPTRYYVYDGIVSIKGVDYEVDFDTDQPYIILRDGKELLVYNHAEVKDKVQFLIRKKDNVKLKIDHIHCTKWDDTINGWVNVNTADKMHIYTDSTQYNLSGGQVIVATPIVAQNVFLPLLNDSYVIYHGNKYEKSGKKMYAVLNDKEYEILTVNDVNYFIHDGNTVNITIDGTNWSTNYTYGTMTKGQGTIKEYDYVVINNVEYLLKEEKLPTLSNDASERVIIGTMVYDDQPLRLKVENVTKSNCLRCSLICDFENGGWIQYLIANKSNYNFEIYSSLFNEGDIEPYTYQERSYLTIQYRLFDPIQKISIPIIAKQEVGLNLHQEDLLNSQFVDAEIKKSINPIIDMEKDIYYPYYQVGSDTSDTFEMVDQIQIDLHFRSRDLNTWKINEDNEISGVNSSWNIFDYYDWDNAEINVLKPKVNGGTLGYYQPSDLVYFLNFKSDDVFYQKKKIEKSFLRLSFFDSKDPNNQTLLHTSTIFMNEEGLYKKFTDNSIDKGLYMSVNEIDDESERILNVPNIQVNYEAQSSIYNKDEAFIMPQVLFDETKRLSSQFVIKNRYESSESSEGFYLYMFRDFSPNLEKKTIYMKVEFNHAGVGKTLNFMQPFSVDNDGKKTMLNLSEPISRNAFKKGYSLEELYDHLYIEIKCKYNKEKRCFMYYLPTWLTEHNDTKNIMKLNLYEVKIKDDSIE